VNAKCLTAGATGFAVVAVVSLSGCANGSDHPATGTLTGQMSVGCGDSALLHGTPHGTVVVEQNGKRVQSGRFPVSGTDTYRFALPPGTYTVGVMPMGVFGRVTASVTAGKTTRSDLPRPNCF
jgi:hypothetical protein